MAAPGAVQMAVDRWLLHQHQQGQSPPVLRFYTWSPAAISLGYHQRRWPQSWRNLVWQGQPVDLVRRPSGGRAVLHAGDLTYALVASGFKGERLQVYRQVCQFLVEGLEALGVRLVLGAAGRGYIHNPSCFGTATGADLVGAADPAQKIIGSAQFWSAGCLLQHGSIRLSADNELYREVFGEPGNSVCPLPQALAELPEEMRIQRLIAELKSAAERCFDTCFDAAALTEAEVEAAVEAFSLPV
ncbi:MAG: lipoate--protein ligase family protein [Cyanobacteria bacterium Co-bin8]|nr:lipoate--protein ligase family protein [Cyanobacteria bacterium Co-bin8]